MAAPMFMKRPRPGGGAAPAVARRAAATRARSPSSGSEGPLGGSHGAVGNRAVARRGVGGEAQQQPRRATARLSMRGGDSGDDELAGNFRVKKSKLSRQMSARGGPAPPPSLTGADGRAVKGPRRGTAEQAAGDSRRHAVGSRKIMSPEDGGQIIADSDEETATGVVVTGEELHANMGANDDDDAESEPDVQAATAARLARAQRAAARELNGAKGETEAAFSRPDYIPLVASKPSAFAAAVREGAVNSVAEPGTERSSPFEATPELSSRAIVIARSMGPGESEVDPVEAWAQQQMRMGAHRRHGDLSQLEAEKLAGSGAIPAPRSFAPLQRKSVNGDTGVHWTDRTKAEATKVQSPAVAIAQLWETMKKIEGGHEERTKRAEELEAQRLNAFDQLKELENQERGIDKTLRAVQELEDLAWSLGGLLDAKVGKLKQASQTLAQMEGEVAANRKRRRIRCLVDDLVHTGGAMISRPIANSENDAAQAEALRSRRDARRERKQKRGLTGIDGNEGWETSSADEQDGLEEWASDRAALCSAAHKQLMGDVSEEFASASALLGPLRKAKKHLIGEYEKAFVPMSLPEMLSMHVEHSMLWWDPLQLCPTGSRVTPKSWGPLVPLTGSQLEAFDWFTDLADFSELQGEEDPDSSLVPELVQRCVFPDVRRRIRECWDVTSARQTAQVAALLDECLLFEVDTDAEKASLSSSGSKPVAFADLLSAAHQRLEEGLAEHAPEVFVPREGLSRWYDSKSRWRLLWRSCKIAHCAMLLDGRIPDEQLSALVLHHVFTMRIAPHLRAPRTDPMELALVDRFTAELPRRWLDGGLPPALKPLRDALGPRANVAAAAAAGPAVAEAAARVLRALRCFDEAQVIVDTLPHK